mgnify:CR=1 FL=1|tara:strand:+ start:1754 stop:2152 length:399 start_codon:yes stop_codon:yes gene_type:complete
MLKRKKIKIGSNRSFGIVFFIALLIIAFWNFRGDFYQIKIFPFLLSLVFLILGIINSKFLTPLNKLWFKLGIAIGSIVAPVIMAIIFFLVVTPIGLIVKIFQKDLLRRKYEKNKNSYWLKRDKPMGSMKQQF